MVAIATRTLNPLHFEDLEPKRFEDLVRQLAHDFKFWRKLEATGRSGADDGFDARGYEITGLEPDAPAPSEQADEVPASVEFDRLWLIQCKRERAIGPTKLMAYLDDVRLRDGEQLHGLVFVAACDFSKKARDRFDEKCKALGLREWHLWGKGELEDKLLLPENDHLLFAYFNISLVIRRRSQRALIRTRLAMKRKALRTLDSSQNAFILLRAPDASAYPHVWDAPDFDPRRPWVVRRYLGVQHDGIKLSVRRFLAHLSSDGTTWDASLAFDDGVGSEHDDCWGGVGRRTDPLGLEVRKLWVDLHPENKAYLDVVGVIPFENILDIDEHGDEFVQSPHVYVAFQGDCGPFDGLTGVVQNLQSFDQRELHLTRLDDARRITFFPEAARHRPKP